MKKLGYNGKKTAKIIHICFIIVWVGATISLLPLITGMQINQYNSVHETYLNMKAINMSIIGWGGIGTLLTGLVLGIFTDWKLFKYNWVTTKFLTFFALTFFEYFFIQLKLFKNVTILESNSGDALHNSLFLHNHSAIIFGIILQLLVFLSLIVISFFKPLTQKEKLKKS